MPAWPGPEAACHDAARQKENSDKVASPLSSGVEGVSGTLTPSSFLRILGSLEGGIEGKRFFDAGCGCGLPVLMTASMGACSAAGVDMTENLEVYSRIFTAGRSSLGISPDTANIELLPFWMKPEGTQSLRSFQICSQATFNRWSVVGQTVV